MGENLIQTFLLRLHLEFAHTYFSFCLLTVISYSMAAYLEALQPREFLSVLGVENPELFPVLETFLILLVQLRMFSPSLHFTA